MKNSLWTKAGTLANKFWETDWNEENDHAFPCRVYDMHGHMGSHSAIYFARCEPEEMVRHLKRCGVTRLVFSHHHALYSEITNSQVYDITARFPEILRFYVSINPHRPADIERDLGLYDSFRPYVVGLKLLPDYHQVAVTDARYSKALEFASERRLPVLVHTWNGSQYDGLEVMLEASRRYPGATFFLGHSLASWQEAAVIAGQRENVYFELTSLPGQAQIIEHMVRDIGSERMLFGTDMPWFDELQHIGGILSADISDTDKENILFRNVENYLGSDW